MQEVQDSLCQTDKKATKPRELEEYGLIERKRRGLVLDLIYEEFVNQNYAF
ncbi:MAG: hypothetical protein ACLVJH_12015 [Faecalibacterium prausnitzii]